MNDNVKTTVYLQAAEYRRLQALAKAEGRSTAELLREAVTEYAQKRAIVARPRSIGVLRSGRGDLSLKADELLEGFGS